MPRNFLLENGGISPSLVWLFVVIAVVIFMLFIVIISRYKKCPSDKIMVIYGKVGSGKTHAALLKMHSWRRRLCLAGCSGL